MVIRWLQQQTVKKLSMYFGIGPEFIYDKALSEDAKKGDFVCGEYSREVTDKDGDELSKEEVLSRAFESVTFFECTEPSTLLR